MLDFAGGVAALMNPAFGRKLNHVTGAFLSSGVQASELDELEATFNGRGLRLEFDLCPHVTPGALSLLTGRGYQLSGFKNTYARDLRELDDGDTFPGIEIVQTGDAAQFTDASARGFGGHTALMDTALLETLARLALARPDSVQFLACVDGELAGSGGVCFVETAWGLAAHLYIASTLSEFRGRGVQGALVQERLRFARQRGAVLASLTARPLNVSARNAERAGLRLAHTKVSLTQGG